MSKSEMKEDSLSETKCRPARCDDPEMSRCIGFAFVIVCALLLTMHERKTQGVQGIALYIMAWANIIFVASLFCDKLWLLPHYYTVFTPVLAVVITVHYWKQKRQFCLLNYCYFGNILFFAYLMAFPKNQYCSMVMFGLANGPLPFATILVRNSLVLHRLDKLIGIYVHLLPALTAFGARWYSAQMSRYWIMEFNKNFEQDVGQLFLWMIAGPLACYVVNVIVKDVLIFLVFRPGDEYNTSFRRFKARPLIKKYSKGRCSLLVYHGAELVYILGTLLITPLLYLCYAAHSVCLVLVIAVVVVNGAMFHDHEQTKSMKEIGLLRKQATSNNDSPAEVDDNKGEFISINMSSNIIHSDI